MHIGIVGSGAAAEAWARAMEQTSGVTLEHRPRVPDVHSTPDLAALVALLERSDALFVGGASGQRFALAEVAMKRAVPLLLDWPPTTSLEECGAAVQLAEEAGVEVGVSRPLRFCPALLDLPRAPRLVTLRLPLAAPPASARAALSDAVDLATCLAGRGSVRRMEVEAVRGAGAAGSLWLEALGTSLRFHGTFAQLTLARPADGQDSAADVTAVGPGFRRRAALPVSRESIPEAWRAAEATAFAEALRERRPPPVPLREGLRVMRLVERVVQLAR